MRIFNVSIYFHRFPLKVQTVFHESAATQLGGIFDPKRPLYETLENMVFANTKFSFPQDIYQAYAYTCTSYTAGSRGCSLVNVL
jgi:hypothetical protein